MSDFIQNPPGCVQKVRERADWRMKFAPKDAPPAAPQRDLDLEARLLDLAVDHDAAVAMEDGSERTPEGYPIFAEYSPNHPRPFVVGGTLYN